MERLLRTVVWAAQDGPRSEHLALWGSTEGYRISAVMIGVEDSQPVRATYELTLTAGWGVRSLKAQWQAGEAAQSLTLHHGGSGDWHGPTGPIPHLAGCLAVDIAWTPFTNTLPIRRLGLKAGESRELLVAYIPAPTLAPRPVRQRYTCLSDGRWRYESLASGYTAELTVDVDGLVIEYPGAFHRIATAP